MKSRTSWLRKMAAGMLGLCALVIAAEMALRVSVSPNGVPRFDGGSFLDSGRWVGHPFLPFAGKPGLSFGSIANNSYGFQSPEFPVAKQPNDYFVVALGEGSTRSDIDADGATWPELLEQKLRRNYPDVHVVVFNLGSEVATSAFSVVSFALVGVHLLPDLVIVYHGCNEANAIAANGGPTGQSRYFANLKPARLWHGWESRLPRWLLGSYLVAKLFGAQTVENVDELRALVVAGPAGESGGGGIDATLDNFATLQSVARERGAETLFSTYRFKDARNPVQRAFNERLREFFESRALSFVDQEASTAAPAAGSGPAACTLDREEQELVAESFARHVVAAKSVERRTLGTRAGAAEIPTEFSSVVHD